MIKPIASVSAYQTDYAKSGVTREQTQKDSNADTAYTLSLSPESRRRNRGNPVTETEMKEIQEQVDRNTSALRDLVEKLITRQSGLPADYALPGETGGDGLPDLSDLADMTPEEARQAVSDDGFWGVEAVSDRIVDFAKSISGGDVNKADALKAAIEKGFASAKKALGGELPDISHQTHEAVMKKLDDWVNGTESAGETEPEAAGETEPEAAGETAE